MKKSFLNYDKAILTTMVQADNPDRIKELIGDKTVVKAIVVPKRLVNIVVK